jgi:hypothetical protein
MSQSDVDVLLSGVDETVRAVAQRLRELVRAVVPDAVEEVDAAARLVGYTFLPGTYKGLIVAIAPHAAHVNLMFAKGVELVDQDAAGLLEGTGRKARHIRFQDPSTVDRAEVRALVAEAARRTPRA